MFSFFTHLYRFNEPTCIFLLFSLFVVCLKSIWVGFSWRKNPFSPIYQSLFKNHLFFFKIEPQCECLFTNINWWNHATVYSVLYTELDRLYIFLIAKWHKPSSIVASRFKTTFDFDENCWTSPWKQTVFLMYKIYFKSFCIKY